MSHHPEPWQDHPADEVVSWAPVDPPRAVEGPLDLAHFRDHVLALDLAPGQVAVQVVDGRIRRVILDGHHRLDLRTTPAEGSLVFIRDDVPIAWRWSGEAHLHPTPATSLPLRGACALRIVDPLRFLDAVLGGLTGCPPERLASVLETLVLSQLEHRVPELVGRDHRDPLQAKILLERMRPEDLDEELADLGLTCSHLAVAVPVVGEVEIMRHASPPLTCVDDLF